MTCRQHVEDERVSRFWKSTLYRSRSIRWLSNAAWPLYAFKEIIKWPKRPLYGFPHKQGCAISHRLAAAVSHSLATRERSTHTPHARGVTAHDKFAIALAFD